MSKTLRLSVCAFNEGLGDPPADGFDITRVDLAMELAREAKNEGAQLAVFPENFLLRGLTGASMDRAEPLDGPVFCKMAQTARKLDMFIAGNHPGLIDGLRHNTTVLFDRGGKLVGCYHKGFPTIWELEAHCSPGDGAVVLDTEIGRIGFATCFDLNYAELRCQYRDLDPDVILFCSAFRGGFMTRMWAFETRAYFVSSVIDPCSRIINPIGRILKETDGRDKVMTNTIELDCEVIHYDYNKKLMPELREKYGDMIDIDFNQPEGVFLLSATGGISIDQIIDQMKLERCEDYFRRSRENIAEAAKGNFPPPGPTAW